MIVERTYKEFLAEQREREERERREARHREDLAACERTREQWRQKLWTGLSTEQQQQVLASYPDVPREELGRQLLDRVMSIFECTWFESVRVGLDGTRVVVTTTYLDKESRHEAPIECLWSPDWRKIWEQYLAVAWKRERQKEAEWERSVRQWRREKNAEQAAERAKAKAERALLKREREWNTYRRLHLQFTGVDVGQFDWKTESGGGQSELAHALAPSVGRRPRPA